MNLTKLNKLQKGPFTPTHYVEVCPIERNDKLSEMITRGHLQIKYMLLSVKYCHFRVGLNSLFAGTVVFTNN